VGGGGARGAAGVACVKQCYLRALYARDGLSITKAVEPECVCYEMVQTRMRLGTISLNS